MVPHLQYFVLNAVQTVFGVAVLVLLIRARELKTYWPLLAMSTWQAPAFFVLLYVRYEGRAHMTPIRAYHLYFDTFWPAAGISAICSLIFPYVLYRSAMRPLKGLQKLGNIVFAWVAVISSVTGLSVALAPTATGLDPLILAVSQLERLSAILILSLVAFVAMAIRPMGLSVRSRVFGASIGTLIVAATNMMQAIYMLKPRGFYNTHALIQLTSSCVALAIWIYYFAKPEPQRRFILLPTTSPFHHWNRVSEMLGHEPGVVAIGGVDPDAFARSEVEVFRRASAKMNEIEAQQKSQTTTLNG